MCWHSSGVVWIISTVECWIHKHTRGTVALRYLRKLQTCGLDCRDNDVPTYRQPFLVSKWSARKQRQSGVKYRHVNFTIFINTNVQKKTVKTCQRPNHASTLCLKKVPTFKLSVTLWNLNRLSKFLHYCKAYEICYKTHTTIPTSP